MVRSTYARVTMIAIATALLLGVVVQVLAQSPANAAFEATWARTDKPVLDGSVPRTWVWGPGPRSEGMMEPYQDSPSGERLVQYYDKSRMELTNPDAPNDSPWYVTNGLLVLEMVEGYVQTGDTASEPAPVSDIPVAGDSNYEDAPSYATVGELMDLPPRTEGASITEVVQSEGAISVDPALADHGVTSAVSAVEYGRAHRVASVFLEFMQQRGMVHVDGELVEDRLFQNDYYATGLPIAEAYWARVSVGGTEKVVLFQCFERRCLTYTPDNPDGWKVEAGNVGQHYYAWRYESADRGDDEPGDGEATSTATEGIDQGSPTATEDEPGDPPATSTEDSGGGDDPPAGSPTTEDPGDPTATEPSPTSTVQPTATTEPSSTATETATATESDNGSGGDGPTNPSSAAICLNSQESTFLNLINDYRQDNGVGALSASKTLNVASHYHSQDMSDKDYLDHTDQDGDSPWDRMAEAGYTYNTSKAENIARGYGSAQAVFDGWRSSSTHNENMLNPNLNAIGIGYVSSGGYWTTNFGGLVDAGPGC